MQSNRANTAVGNLDGLSDQAVLDVVVAGVAQLRRTTFASTVDDDALRDRVVRLQRLESSVHAEKLRSIAEVDERKAFQAAAQRSTADWVADACGLTPTEARAQARNAEALSRLPETSKKLADGAITPGHADAAVRGLSELDRHTAARRQDAGADLDAWDAAVESGEQVLAEFDAMVADTAVDQDRLELGKTITGWTAQHEPDALADRERRAWRHRGIRLASERDDNGLWQHRIGLTDAAHAQFLATLEPLARKTSRDDDRTIAQRRHDALVAMAGAAAASDAVPTTGGTRAQVLVVRDEPEPDTTAGPAHVDGIGPVTDATADLLSCDAATTVIRRDPHSRRIWDVGQADGDPSPKQRKAVLARDRVCVGCGAPAARCQIHHIRWRRHGGATATANLVLVCWSCHNGIHHLGWQITGDQVSGFSINRHPNPHATAGADPGAGPDRRHHQPGAPPHL